MPATSASQQRLFGMVHAYQKGKLKHAPWKVRDIARHISEEDAEHFARTSHDGLPDRKGGDGDEEEKAAASKGRCIPDAQTAHERCLDRQYWLMDDGTSWMEPSKHYYEKTAAWPVLSRIFGRGASKAVPAVVSKTAPSARELFRREIAMRNGLSRIRGLIPEFTALRSSGLKGDAFMKAMKDFGAQKVWPVVASARDAIIRRLNEVLKRHSFETDWKGTYERVSRLGGKARLRNPERVLEEVSAKLQESGPGGAAGFLRSAFEHGWKYNGIPSKLDDGVVSDILAAIPSMMKKSSYRDGFLSKLAEYGVDPGFLYKKADPPNRGLNDPNPVKRHVYRTVGFVPQAPGSYLSEANSAGMFNKTISDTNRFAIDLYRPMNNRKTPIDELAARYSAGMLDLRRATGDMPSQFASVSKSPSPDNSLVILGSYPDGELALRHELGHARHTMVGDGATAPELRREVTAWDYAGVPWDNPVRDAALDTYRAKERHARAMGERSWFTGPFRRWWADRSYNREAADARDRLIEASKASYSRPETFIGKYLKAGLPIVYDYNSALGAARKGLLP